jgi:predicted NBD/HSP70 family sugar kinase
VGGKKPEIFAFNAAFAHVAAMAIRQDQIHGAITDLRGNPLCRREAECGAEVDYESALAKLAEMLTSLIRDAGLSPPRLCGLTLGCEGVVNAENSLVRYTLQHDWGRNLDLGGDLVRRLPFPIRVRVDNSVRLAGYNHRDDDQLGTIVVINSGRTTSGSVIEARDLIHGDNGFVGEFGHMVMEPSSSLKCRCGGRGCFEALVSPDLVLDAARRSADDFPQSPLRPRALSGDLAMPDVFAAADAGDELARALLDPVIGYFSLLAHNIVLLRDPARIVIQGPYAGAGDYFLSSLRNRLRSIPFYKMAHELAIDYAKPAIGDPAVLGAARFGADEFLKNNRLYD